MKAARLFLLGAFVCTSYALQADDTSRRQSSSAGSSGSNHSGSEVLTPLFRSFDKNGDGVLTKEEAMAYPRARNGAFEQADMDRDGKLTPEEFKILYANTSEDRRLGSK